MSKIEIKRDKYTHVYIDGQEVKRIRGYVLEEDVDTLPTITIDCFAESDIEIEGVVRFRSTDLIEKVKKLQTYKLFKDDSDLYVSLNDVLKVLNGE